MSGQEIRAKQNKNRRKWYQYRLEWLHEQDVEKDITRILGPVEQNGLSPTLFSVKIGPLAKMGAGRQGQKGDLNARAGTMSVTSSDRSESAKPLQALNVSVITFCSIRHWIGSQLSSWRRCVTWHGEIKRNAVLRTAKSLWDQAQLAGKDFL